MSGHGRASQYLDGELDIAAEAAFLDHLVACEACQAELHDQLQLRDREDQLRDAAGAASEMHGRAGEYLDAALDAAAEAAFLDHLVACEACQVELHDEVQLRDREDVLRGAAPSAAPARRERRAVPEARETAVRDTEDLAARVGPHGGTAHGVPQRRRRVAAWSAGLAAAAAVAVLALWLRPGPVAAPIALLDGATSPVEIRLSHPAAAAHRPYDTLLGSAGPSKEVPLAVRAALEAAGDCEGVATADLLSGELARADERFRRCPAGPDVEADRAGLAVLRHDFAAALDLTEAVLDAAPRHVAALWNRALALHGLGLDLSAAAAFERVADLDVLRAPGWSADARQRASALRTELALARTAYNEVRRLGIAMVKGGPPLPAGLARQVPWRSRLYLHDAIRTATTAARLDELAPLAAALEGRAGRDLAHYLAGARERMSPERAEAAVGYREMFDREGAVDDRAWASWLPLAARARDDDLILGARILTRRLDGEPSADRLAAATGDPWFELAVGLARGRAALAAGRIEEAAARFDALQARCPPSQQSYRCLQLAMERSQLASDRHQPRELEHEALTALAMARALREWPQLGLALVYAAEADRFGGDFASARAYDEESALARDACGAHNAAFEIAEMLFQRHRVAQAQARAAAAPACGSVPSLNELTVLVRLRRAGHPVLERAEVAARIARTRAAPPVASYVPYLDYLAAWLTLDDDPAAGERLAAIAERARGVEGAVSDKTLAAVDNARFADAGRRAAWSDALGVAARAHGTVVPARCALAFGADDFRFTAVAVGPGGAILGHYDPDLARAAEWLAPQDMRRQLAGCDDVAVLALPPRLGIGPVLDPQAPWHYVLGPPPAPHAGPARHVVVSAPITPPDAGLAPLAPRTWPAASGPDELLTGSFATPERVLGAIADATLVEIHSHAISPDPLDAPVLALAPGGAGWTLGAAQIRSTRLTGAPIVLLVDCAGGAAARFEHQAWGLPLAFRNAGASAVIASLAAIPDRESAAFFAAVTAELARGASPAIAVARVRAEKMVGDAASWMRDVVVFQ